MLTDMAKGPRARASETRVRDSKSLRPVYSDQPVDTPNQDLRNHGDSSHNPRHDYTALGEDVEGFIRQHKLEKPTLIGHSMFVPSLPPQRPSKSS